MRADSVDLVGGTASLLRPPYRDGDLCLPKTRSRGKKEKYGSRGERITRVLGPGLLRLPRKQARCQLLGREDPAGVHRQQPIFKEGSVSGGPSFVAVVQSADLWQRHDSSHLCRLDRSGLGRVLPQREMRSRSLIVIQVRSEGATKRGFMQHDHMVQALPPNGTNHPLNVGSLPGRARRRQNFANAQASHLVSEVITEDGIAVAQQIARQLVEGKGLS